MRMVLMICCLLVSSTAFAQLEPCLNVSSQANRSLQAGSEQSPLQQAAQQNGLSRFRKRSPYQPALGLSQFMFDGESHTAPAMGMQYIPTTSSAYKLTFSGGLVWLPKSSSVISSSPYSGVGPYRFVNGGYGQSSPSLLLGYVGTEYRYYLLQGDIQPYIGAGAHALGWKYGTVWGSTVAPSVMGGVSAEITTVFSGYIELRQLIGVGTILGTSQFGGSTSVSAGFAFAPNLSSW